MYFGRQDLIHNLGEDGGRRCKRSPVAQLFGEQGTTGGPIEGAVRDPDSFMESLEHFVMAIGMFANVHGR